MLKSWISDSLDKVSECGSAAKSIFSCTPASPLKPLDKLPGKETKTEARYHTFRQVVGGGRGKRLGEDPRIDLPLPIIGWNAVVSGENMMVDVWLVEEFNDVVDWNTTVWEREREREREREKGVVTDRGTDTQTDNRLPQFSSILL